MKINLTPTIIEAARKKKRAASSLSRLPGEPRPFTPITKRTLKQLNLVPPQHLGPDGSITSSRTQEVTKQEASVSPLVLRINELEAENALLRTQLEALQ